MFPVGLVSSAGISRESFSAGRSRCGDGAWGAFPRFFSIVVAGGDVGVASRDFFVFLFFLDLDFLRGVGESSLSLSSSEEEEQSESRNALATLSGAFLDKIPEVEAPSPSL